MKTPLITCLLIIISICAYAQGQFENLITLKEGGQSPPATIQDVSWIQGHWRGEALGGIVEEIWSPPLGGSMMCSFKLVKDNQVAFYEMVTIFEEGNSLMLKLKHFHSDLKGWEEKDETVDFPLVKITEEAIYFDGFTFKKSSDSEMTIYVLFSHDGQQEEYPFHYKRYQ